MTFEIAIQEGARPVLCREHQVPYNMKETGTVEINKLVVQGILVPTEQTDWLSPVVVVWKKNGKVRIYGDFRILNKSIISDKFPLPGTEKLFAQLGTKNTLFAKLDLETAYHQVPLAKECRSLTTIATHLGTFI